MNLQSLSKQHSEPEPVKTTASNSPVEMWGDKINDEDKDPPIRMFYTQELGWIDIHNIYSLKIGKTIWTCKACLNNI